jgi:phosphatidylglycerol:prolipoprotein diacylglycerol transferase
LFPILFSLRVGGGEVSVHSYGVMVAAGLAAGVAYAYRAGRHEGLDGGRVLDLAFWMIVAGLLGSRLVYALVNAGDFAGACLDGTGAPRSLREAFSDCTRIFQIWQGGLVFYGGVVAAVAVAWRFARRENWSFARVGDIFAPALALGHAIGRIGCFAAGCCFGKESASAIAVAFPRGSVAFDELAAAGAIPPGAGMTAPLHPTQLYEALGELAIFVLLVALRRRLRARAGATLLLYLALYAPLRFVVEIFRGDVTRRFVVALDTPCLASWLHLPLAESIFLSVGQLTSLVVMLAVVVVAWRVTRRPRKSSAAKAG